MNSDWLYTEDRMALREKCLSILLTTYGRDLDDNGVPLHSTESIYACAHDWISQGNDIPHGISKYYETYYKGVKPL